MNYEKLDHLIVEAIKGGLNSFTPIFNSRNILKEAHRISNANSRDTDRIVDSRLQALRKRGLIEHAKGRGWIAKEAA